MKPRDFVIYWDNPEQDSQPFNGIVEVQTITNTTPPLLVLHRQVGPHVCINMNKVRYYESFEANDC